MLAENRHARRARVSQASRRMRIADRFTLLSIGLAASALAGRFSRNEARRRLKAEAVRVLGAKVAQLLSPLLMSVKELGA
jgi:hypothetical protein